MEIVAWYASIGNPDVTMYEKYFFGRHPTTYSTTLVPSSKDIDRIAPTPRFFSDKNFEDLCPSSHDNDVILLT